MALPFCGNYLNMKYKYRILITTLGNGEEYYTAESSSGGSEEEDWDYLVLGRNVASRALALAAIEHHKRTVLKYKLTTTRYEYVP